MSKTLRGWHAKRAGGRITAYGVNIDTNEPDRITNIDRLDPPHFAGDHHVLATDKSGDIHKLIFS